MANTRATASSGRSGIVIPAYDFAFACVRPSVYSEFTRHDFSGRSLVNDLHSRAKPPGGRAERSTRLAVANGAKTHTMIFVSKKPTAPPRGLWRRRSSSALCSPHRMSRLPLTSRLSTQIRSLLLLCAARRLRCVCAASSPERRWNGHAPAGQSALCTRTRLGPQQ